MKPILFNTEMVRAILEGLKTVTRRVVKPQPLEGVREMYQSTSRGRTVWRSPGEHVWCEVPAPFHPGDTLWVRETWAKSMSGTFMYKADGKAILVERWHPSIHMPREAARIFLRVTDVRVARLQDCGNMQAKDEGCVSCILLSKNDLDDLSTALRRMQPITLERTLDGVELTAEVRPAHPAWGVAMVIQVRAKEGCIEWVQAFDSIQAFERCYGSFTDRIQRRLGCFRGAPVRE